LTQPPKRISHATPYVYKRDVAPTESSSNDTARALPQPWAKERAEEEAPRTWAARRPRVRRARPTPPTQRSRPRSRRRKPQRQPSGRRAQSPTRRRTPTHLFLETSHILISNSEAAAAKAAEAERKKQEKALLLAQEEASLPSKPKGAGAKKAEKKPSGRGGGIDSALGAFDSKPSALNATGIENALDALDIAADNKDKLDRHPERRFKAAYAAYEERRLEEMKDEKGLRRNQKVDQIRKEFEKHPDNPFNQVNATYNASREDMAAIRDATKAEKERRLASGL
jgi:hypothetical protein